MLESFTAGGGQVERAGSAHAVRARLRLPPSTRQAYADAQLDDYHRRAPARRLRLRPEFPNVPPLRMVVRARASLPAPVGTLGFGFWNDPFSLSGAVLASPNTAWFFYASPPSDMSLAEGVPGWGWKAATLNTGRLPGVVLAPAALAAIALTRLPGLGRPIMAAARRIARAHEVLLDDVSLAEWHEYALEWRAGSATFWVDGIERLRSPAPPRGPLGFVAWLDNQYAVASLEGRFGFGLCATKEEQWLELDGLNLTRLE